MASIPIIPPEILLEIFLRLSAKSVGKCRCLSKTWHTQLSTKQFINSHLKIHQKEKLILVNNKSGSLHLLTLPFENNDPLTEIQLGNKWIYVLTSCNGLVLLIEQRKDNNMFVANPITRQLVKIPCSGSGLHTYGFGYDTSSDDYKIVKISDYYSWDEHRRYAFVDVYYLKTSVWKRIGNAKLPFDLSHIRASNSVMPLVNEAVHWAVIDTHKMYRILAFDLDNETFREVQLPTRFKKNKRLYKLTLLKGCLSILRRFSNGLSADIWMMKDYKVVDSWVRFRFNANVMGRGILPICFVGDEELLCVDVNERDCWIVCDLKDQGMEQKMVGGRIPFSVIGKSSCSVFVESLVSPEQGTVSS